MALTCACSVFSGGTNSSSFTGSPSSTASAIPAASSDGAFPLTPNPQSVHITLDTAHAVSNKSRARAGVANIDSLSGTDAGGNSFNLGVSETLLTQDTDGSLVPAFGTAVTVTPVSSIPDIPFGKGYLAAFQMAPEGLLIADPATLELTIKGDYNSSDLVGFASDGNGADFHLFPIQAISGGGTTTVLMDISHFSMYGVAQATAAEVASQLSHPPASASAQDDDLLAAPESKAEQKLSKEHDRLVKPTIDLLDKLSGNCNTVAVGALKFETWSKHVQSAGEQNHFQDTINNDANVLKERLKDCLKTTCPLCIQSSGQTNSQAKKPNRKTVDQLLTYSAFMQSIDLTQGNADDANFWREISNQCAKNAGLPEPSPHVAECLDCGKGTQSPLTCPEP